MIRKKYWAKCMERDYKLKIFDSSLFNILPSSMHNSFSKKEKAMLYLRAVRGYRVIYFEDIRQSVIAWCFLKKDYLNKYPFMRKEDALINPYFTNVEYRGRGIAQTIIRQATEMREYKSIYALVKSDNLPSIAVLKKCGFKKIGWSGKKLWSHTVSQNEGSVIIFRYNQV